MNYYHSSYLVGECYVLSHIYLSFLFRKQNNGFLFGIPFDIFNDENQNLQENVRPVRKTPVPPTHQPSAFGLDPYLSSSGIPLYKYR